jgi:hypothetical protein
MEVLRSSRNVTVSDAQLASCELPLEAVWGALQGGDIRTFEGGFIRRSRAPRSLAAVTMRYLPCGRT